MIKTNWIKLASALGTLAFAVLSPFVAAQDDDESGTGLFIPANSAAQNFYGGVSFGNANIDYPDSNQDGSVSGITDDDTDTVYSLFAGYQLNDYLAVQGAHHDLGESDFAGVSDGSGESWVAGNVTANLESDGWELGVLGRWPLADRWYALGYVGWFWWESTETFTENGFVSVEKDSGSDVSYAVGFEYDVGLKDRVVYRFMGSQRQVDDTEYDVSAVGAEIVYIFP